MACCAKDLDLLHMLSAGGEWSPAGQFTAASGDTLGDGVCCLIVR